MCESFKLFSYQEIYHEIEDSYNTKEFSSSMIL